MFKRFWARLVLAFIANIYCISAYAIAPICQEGTVNIAATDTAISFNGSFSHIIIKTSSTAAIVYVSPNNTTATSADFQVDPGASLNLGLAGHMAAQTGFHYIGASATGTLSWLAY